MGMLSMLVTLSNCTFSFGSSDGEFVSIHA